MCIRDSYWSWYGFDSRVEWCACFVSWCADQCGYIESGLVPNFAGCVDGANWFKSNGKWPVSYTHLLYLFLPMKQSEKPKTDCSV